MEHLRQLMVQRQLRGRGLADERVLEAMGEVPREEFVPDSVRESAYDDSPLPIGHGQTISQPYTVACMCEALRLEPGHVVLEIGTGSGYAACVLSRLVERVYSVERIPELAASVRKRISRLGYDNVEVHLGDGTLGLPERAPFDRVVVTAGAGALPTAYLDQLRVGGCVLIPMGRTPHSQSMYRFTKRDGELEVENLGGFAFVPLIGEHGWSDAEINR